MIVLHWSKFTVLFLDKEEWGSLGGLGWSNSSCLQIFFHKSGAGAQLLGVQWVQFGDFWYKRVFKVYSVIKISVGRKGVEHLFSKYIGVFRVLGGRIMSSLLAVIASSVERVVFQMCLLSSEMVLFTQSILGLCFANHNIPSTI